MNFWDSNKGFQSFKVTCTRKVPPVRWRVLCCRLSRGSWLHGALRPKYPACCEGERSIAPPIAAFGKSWSHSRAPSVKSGRGLAEVVQPNVQACLTSTSSTNISKHQVGHLQAHLFGIGGFHGSEIVRHYLSRSSALCVSSNVIRPRWEGKSLGRSFQAPMISLMAASRSATRSCLFLMPITPCLACSKSSSTFRSSDLSAGGSIVSPRLETEQVEHGFGCSHWGSF